MTDMWNTMTISAYGMRAQGIRSRVIAENIANSSTAAPTPKELPYIRKQVVFKNELDKANGTRLVKVDRILKEKPEQFPIKFMPDHPGANSEGYVKMPNVNMIIELNDMREAQRTYEANLGMIEQSRSMMLRTIDLLR